ICFRSVNLVRGTPEAAARPGLIVSVPDTVKPPRAAPRVWEAIRPCPPPGSHEQSPRTRPLPAGRPHREAAAARRWRGSRLRRPLQRRQVQRAQRVVPAERARARVQDPGAHPAAGVLRTAPVPGPLPRGPAGLRLREGAAGAAGALAVLHRRLFPQPGLVARAGGGDGHPPPAEGLRPADARLRRAPWPARARPADQGRQALARGRDSRGAGGPPGAGVFRWRDRGAGVLGRVEARGGGGPRRGRRLARAVGGSSRPVPAYARMEGGIPLPEQVEPMDKRIVAGLALLLATGTAGAVHPRLAAEQPGINASSTLALGGASSQQLAQTFTLSTTGYLSHVMVPVTCQPTAGVLVTIEKV